MRRYKCRRCGRTYSDGSYDAEFGQKKRQFNGALMEFLSGAATQRRLAINFKLNRKTVVRKFIFLGEQALRFLETDLLNHPPARSVEFDDLETIEHSKLKPLSICAVVETGTRRILGFTVAQMSAKGPLAQKSRDKYGVRKDGRTAARNLLFKELQEAIAPDAVLKSDEDPRYKSSVKRFFPQASHKVYKGRRGCVVGQGELKAVKFDPLFTLNHTYAMFRANISRLVRRTWTTTKKRERLVYHVAIYAIYHNWKLLPTEGRPPILEMMRLVATPMD